MKWLLFVMLWRHIEHRAESADGWARFKRTLKKGQDYRISQTNFQTVLSNETWRVPSTTILKQNEQIIWSKVVFYKILASFFARYREKGQIFDFSPKNLQSWKFSKSQYGNHFRLQMTTFTEKIKPNKWKLGRIGQLPCFHLKQAFLRKSTPGSNFWGL